MPYSIIDVGDYSTVTVNAVNIDFTYFTYLPYFIENIGFTASSMLMITELQSSIL
jgi:hypothetical protein